MHRSFTTEIMWLWVFTRGPGTSASLLWTTQLPLSLATADIHTQAFNAGRLGNTVAAIKTAMSFAIVKGCTLHVPHFRRNDIYTGVDIPSQPTVFNRRHNCTYEAHLQPIYKATTIFWFQYFRHQFPVEAKMLKNLTSHQAGQIRKNMQALLAINRTSVLGLPCSEWKADVALQLRSGDVMAGMYVNGDWVSKQVHKGYGQPPLSFYLQCMHENLHRKGGTVAALCEDFNNPVCVVLRTLSRTIAHDSNSSHPLHVQTLPLNYTIATLGCSPVVCGAHSSMAGVYVNSIHTKVFVAADGHEVVSRAERWNNTAEQRMMMLHRRS